MTICRGRQAMSRSLPGPPEVLLPVGGKAYAAIAAGPGSMGGKLSFHESRVPADVSLTEGHLVADPSTDMSLHPVLLEKLNAALTSSRPALAA